MAERSDYLYAQVRKKMLDAVRMDLIGPTAAEEALTELPTNSYITGMLYPADSDITEDENYNDVEFTEGRLDADGNGSESVVLEDEEPDESTKGGFKKPSSIGVSFYLSEETNKINVDVYWGSYYSDKVDDGEVVDESIEEDYENKKKKKRQVYVREQMAETVELNLDDIGRAKTIPLHSNAHIFIYVIQMRLDNGYKMLSVYLHNNNKGGDEKEYERVMFQVELHVSTKDKEAVFIPEYICRKQELEDEYYYKGRPIFGRGRGCAATWNKREDEENAYSIDSTFIPDHEIPGVSAQVKDVPEKAFSMLQLGSPKKKEVSIANLRLLTALYGDWIKNELKENPQMQESSFQATGKSIIEKCLDSLRRMNEGIDLIEKDENAFKAFTFMNQSMYLQRSITAYSKDCGRGIPCSLSDYMKDNKEKGIEQDHSEWRPFQIAFILLNIKGLIDPESDERNIVDLLYFPTGGGKTEAYLGLIAFIIAYRRLTSDSDSIELVITAPETFRIKTKKTRDVVEKLIKNAEKSVVMTGYSISDYFTGMLDTIIAKSQQGVYVRFYVNDIEKSRASLVKMLAYRSKYLQFFEYEKNSDDKMAASHAKILTIDSDKSLVSSANLSYHGLSGNIEMGFLVRSADKAKQIEELLKELVRMHVYKKIS